MSTGYLDANVLLRFSYMEHAGEPNLYTFGQGFDRVPGLTRREPPPLHGHSAGA